MKINLFSDFGSIKKNSGMALLCLFLGFLFGFLLSLFLFFLFGFGFGLGSWSRFGGGFGGQGSWP